MRLKGFHSSVNVKPALISIVLVTNAFVWYYFIFEMFVSAQISQSAALLVWILHYGGIGCSAIVAAVLSKRIKNRVRFLFFWMLSGTVLSFISVIVNMSSILDLTVLSLLFGLSLGYGMPCCMEYFAKNVSIEKRGKVGGIMFMLSGIIIVVLGMVSGSTIGLKPIILTGWRLGGILAFALLMKLWPSKPIQVKNEPSLKVAFGRNTFLLYFVPWLMFSLISNLTIPIQGNVVHIIQIGSAVVKADPTMPSIETLRGIENVIGAVSAVVGGFLLDLVGRKRMSMIGFAMLGVGYSLIGFFSYFPISWYVYTFVDGAAWGIMFVVFVITIWSDISNGSSEKYYAIGVLPYFISDFIRLNFNVVLGDISSIFSFVAFFLFLAILPLAYAPETLPEKIMKDRDLKSYVEKAMKKAQSETGKQKTPSKKPEKDDVEFQINLSEEKEEEYEEAKKLAEKYY